METAESLEVFFAERIDAALRVKDVPAPPLTSHYLVQLLAAYANRPIDDTPLAVKMLEAVDADPRGRRARLREVGDTSLFVSGFYSDSFARKTVDVDYYIGLGGSAYGQLASTGAGWARDPYGDVYEALAEKFSRFVDVLATISAGMQPVAAQDIVRLYDQWKRTGSEWAAHRLAALGVTLQRGGGIQ